MARNRWSMLQDVPKPFLEHLEDLRMTVIKMVATLVTAMVLSFIFVRPILEILYKPLIWAGEKPDKFLKVLGVVDPFMLALQVAFFAGFLFSLPLLLFYIGEFVLPALTNKERGFIAPVFFGGTGLFVAGVAFCYFVLMPQALKFFLNFSTDMGFRSEWTVQNYIGFVVQMLAALGICFELPMVILILAAMGIVDSKMLHTHRKHAVVGIVVLAAVITPTQDMFTLVVMSVPMWLLYEGCVVICWWMERKERAREALERKLAVSPAVHAAATVPQAPPEGGAGGGGQAAGAIADRSDHAAGDAYAGETGDATGTTYPGDTGEAASEAYAGETGGVTGAVTSAAAAPQTGAETKAKAAARAGKKARRKTGKKTGLQAGKRPAKKTGKPKAKKSGTKTEKRVRRKAAGADGGGASPGSSPETTGESGEYPGPDYEMMG